MRSIKTKGRVKHYMTVVETIFSIPNRRVAWTRPMPIHRATAADGAILRWVVVVITEQFKSNLDWFATTIVWIILARRSHSNPIVFSEAAELRQANLFVFASTLTRTYASYFFRFALFDENVIRRRSKQTVVRIQIVKDISEQKFDLQTCMCHQEALHLHILFLPKMGFAPKMGLLVAAPKKGLPAPKRDPRWVPSPLFGHKGSRILLLPIHTVWKKEEGEESMTTVRIQLRSIHRTFVDEKSSTATLCTATIPTYKPVCCTKKASTVTSIVPRWYRWRRLIGVLGVILAESSLPCLRCRRKHMLRPSYFV